MEINKQLFEDVLSGKLKGTFIRRDGNELNSSLLEYSGPIFDKFISIGAETYFIDDGVARNCPYNTNHDIINFIPNTDMKENELTIEMPEGKIVDWEESKKQNKIVLKDKQLTYEDICNKLQGTIDINLFITPSRVGNVLVADVHHLECLLAKNYLATVAKYLNDGWKPDIGDQVFYLTCYGEFRNKLYVCEYCFGTKIGAIENLIVFKSQDAAQQAIEILGEETVKLALEPLGI